MGQKWPHRPDTCHCQLLAGSANDCDDRQLGLTRTSCYFFFARDKRHNGSFQGSWVTFTSILKPGLAKSLCFGLLLHHIWNGPSTPGQRSCPTSQMQDPNTHPSKAMDTRLFFILSLVFAFQQLENLDPTERPSGKGLSHLGVAVAIRQKSQWGWEYCLGQTWLLSSYERRLRSFRGWGGRSLGKELLDTPLGSLLAKALFTSQKRITHSSVASSSWPVLTPVRNWRPG